jgi:hypothetical protein
MGAATKGGGAVSSGPRNKMISTPNRKTSGPVFMAEGGEVEEEGVMGKIKGVGKGLKDVYMEGVDKLRDDFERITGTEKGKQLDKESEKQMRRRLSNQAMKATMRDLRKERILAEAGRYKAGGSVNKGAINQHKRMAMGKKITGGGR